MFSTTTISGYDSSSTTSVTGTVDSDQAGPGNYWFADSWLGYTTSLSSSSTDSFGFAVSESDESLGEASDSDTAGNTYSFGRPLTQSLAGGQSVTNTYINSDGSINFFGPASVVASPAGLELPSTLPAGVIESPELCVPPRVPRL